MKAATSILSFPFVVDPASNPHMTMLTDDQMWELTQEIKAAIMSDQTSLFSHFKLAVNDELVDNPKEILGSTSNTSFQEFMSSLNELCEGNFLLYVSGWNKLKSSITEGLENYLQSLLNLDDETMSTVDFEFFIGRYNKTYGGIHRAECSNLQLVMSGEKTFSYWEPVEFKGWNVEHAVDKYSKGKEEYLLEDDHQATEVQTGIHLDGKPGSVFYIPHGWWHVAKSPELSAAITFAIYHN